MATHRVELLMRGQIVRHRTRSGEPGFWWYRLRVPARLREAMGGRWEIRRSLETEDLGEARRRALEVARWAEQQLAAAQAQIAPLEVDHEAERDRLLDRLTPAWQRWDYSLRHSGVLLGRSRSSGVTDWHPHRLALKAPM